MKPHKFRVGERVRVVLEGTVGWVGENTYFVRLPSPKYFYHGDTDVRPIPRRRKRSMASVVGTLGSSGHQTIDTRRRKKK